MKVWNVTKDREVVTHGHVASGFWSRLRGLMGQPHLAEGEGLLLRPERSIHTFLMRFPIDVLYLNDHNIIIAKTESMPPNRLGPWVRGTRSILELSAGTIARHDISTGDKLAFLDS